MYIVMNRLEVPPDDRERVEGAFKYMSRFEGTPGFLGFELLRRNEANELLAITRWENRESFENWTRSHHFAQAHAGQQGGPSMPSHLETYELVTSSAPTK